MGCSKFDFISGRTYISAFERGIKVPTLGKIEQLAEVLRVHPLTLLALSYLSKAQASEVVRLLSKVADELAELEAEGVAAADKLKLHKGTVPFADRPYGTAVSWTLKMDPLDPKIDLQESEEANAIPTWASGVLRSKAPSEPGLPVTVDRVDMQIDPGSGLPYISVAGFHVVAVEPLTRQALQDGVHLLMRLCSLQPLDIGALALGAEVRLSATLVNQLASRSIMVSRVRVGRAVDNAKTAATEYLALRQRAHDHLDRFIESTSEVQDAREGGAADAPR